MLKHFLNAIRWGFLAIGPAAFEIGFTVKAMVVRLVNMKSFVNRDSTALVFGFVGGKVFVDKV